MWAREIGRMAGVTVPLHASEHFYIVTEPMAGVKPDLPVLRDTDGYIYVREEVGGLLMGGFEPVAKPWGMEGIPADFAFSLLPEDWEHFQVLMEQGIHRIPALETAPVRRHVNGPESFTPDGRYLLGEAPECRGFFVAAGFNSIGIASGAGAGRAVAEWIVGGEPPMDLWDVDIRRVAPFQANPRYLRDRTVEMVGALYALHWPYLQPATARGVRKSALHDRLASRGACLGAVMGWERANWFAMPGMEPVYCYSYGRQNWFASSAEEHCAVREAVGLFDQSSFCKLRLEGPDALAVLQRLCAERRRRATGPVGLHADAQCARRYRGGPDGDPARRRRLLHRHRGGRGHTQHALDRQSDRRRPGGAHRRHVGAGGPRRDGPALA
jgi:4-methylaminobutanoate oxidase (formaldehyde-forming)